MADVWATKDWADRHFAEGLGFWEVNVFKALVYFHPKYASLQHPRFRVLLAHTMLTLGKVELGADSSTSGNTPAGAPDHTYCHLKRYENYKNEKHRCGYCKEGAYFFCATCFPLRCVFHCCAIADGHLRR